VYIRDDEDDESDDDRRKRYPEPHAFLSEDAHLSGKYSKFLISGPNMCEFALFVYHRHSVHDLGVMYASPTIRPEFKNAPDFASMSALPCYR
jgi:hypothetical protein